ncbi:hypothetical protein QFC22_004166 [Naganishia vaughanmartiniae]|uniref:Uncharacterized protein n=1 Tax=Naganishia vaughanmartiniae TaxID=1424756 RepID=A0ACC2X2J7_9TREE|nr:hypothetical protein QFC22_004166 [Naganishia vaughanmartiniae]
MDDGIELNFASSGGPVVARKKQGGRWTDRLKANNLAKRRVDKPKANGAKAPATTASATQSNGNTAKTPTFSLPDIAATKRQNASQSNEQRPTKRPRVDTHNAQTKSADDDFANVDVAALAKASSGQSKSGNASAYFTNKSANQQAAPGAGSQFISSLFSSNPRRADAKTEVDLERDIKGTTHASNAPLPATVKGDTSTFDGLGLDPLLIRHLKGKMSIERPTRIQRVALSGLLDPTPLTTKTPPGDFSLTPYFENDPIRNRDAFIQSQTGSGKTLAYLLPILQTLLPLASRKDIGYIDRSVGTLAIILAPTRELARQIDEVLQRILNGMNLSMTESELEKLQNGDGQAEDGDADTKNAEEAHKQVYGRYLVSAVLTGGATKNHEKNRLRRGCPILVCTPGRLLDHLQNTSSFKCDKLMWLVLDEADRLIEEGFGETLQGIMKALEGRRKIGLELDSTVGRSTRPRVFKKKTASAAKVKIPGFSDDEEDAEADDSDWDYETLGPKGQKLHGTSSNATPLNSSSPSVDHTVWPYWNLRRRTILCSATVSGEVQKLAHVALHNPAMYRGTDMPPGEPADLEEPELKPLVSTTPGVSAEVEEISNEKEEKFTPPSQLDQRYMIVPLKLRLVTLISLMRSLVAKANQAIKTGQQTGGTKIIVFLSCTDSVDFHWQLLGGVSMGHGAPINATGKKKDEQVALNCALLPSTSIMRLHGSLPVATRRSSLQAFASPGSEQDANKNSILLCTSVASRGLDLPLVKAVIQYDLPTEQGINEYVHRVGRTARVGRGGESWAFVEDHEQGWVDWAETGMSNKGDQVQLRQVAVEDVLRRGFGGGSAKSHIEYEARATQVQLAFERWVLEGDEHAALARNAFSSYVRAYSTHPAEEKRFFHVKNLHLGHLAKCFALRETPGKIGAGKPAKGKSGARGQKNGKKGGDDSDDDLDVTAAKGKKRETDVERRMYEAVRKQGRAVRADGKLGELGNDAYQVYGGGSKDLERMVSGRKF